jgi:nucleotide-binding universal stress UspA family protein
MGRTERILVGLDTQAASTTAVRWLIGHIGDRPVRVELVSLFDLLVTDIDRQRGQLDAAQQLVQAAAPRSVVSTALIERGIVEGLVEHSAGYDLLVIGAHPRRPLRSALTGSLPYRIASRASCPTVVVPDDWQARRGDVTVGIADDHSADPAVRFGAEEAMRRGSTLRLVHTWLVPELDVPGDSELVEIESLRKHHRLLLDAAVRRAREEFPHARITGVLGEGDPAATIRDDQSSLVVLGTHHRPPEIAAILGSAALAELSAGVIPVCIVPSDRAAESEESLPRTAVTRELDPSACWEVLGERGVGRLALRAEPEGVDIMPVNYLARDGMLYFKSAPGTKLIELTEHPSVAFEVDHESAGNHVSVVVRGTARRLDADDDIERSGVLTLLAAEPGEKLNYVAVAVETITGRAFRTAAPRR